jgi:hypothetical protein
VGQRSPTDFSRIPLPLRTTSGQLLTAKLLETIIEWNKPLDDRTDSRELSYRVRGSLGTPGLVSRFATVVAK